MDKSVERLRREMLAAARMYTEVFRKFSDAPSTDDADEMRLAVTEAQLQAAAEAWVRAKDAWVKKLGGTAP